MFVLNENGTDSRSKVIINHFNCVFTKDTCDRLYFETCSDNFLKLYNLKMIPKGTPLESVLPDKMVKYTYEICKHLKSESDSILVYNEIEKEFWSIEFKNKESHIIVEGKYDEDFFKLNGNLFPGDL